MKVVHIMRDGSTVRDIRGRVVPFESAKTLYQYIAKKRVRKKEVST